MRILKKRGQNQGLKSKLTSKAFLGIDGSKAYIEPKELLHFIDSARDQDIEELDSFFDLIKEDLKMTINRRVQVDKGGNPYKYENFIRSKGLEGVKVQLIGNIKQFILDYQAGEFIVDFTLEDLVAEAENA
jgi:hypothetical protein